MAACYTRGAGAGHPVAPAAGLPTIDAQGDSTLAQAEAPPAIALTRDTLEGYLARLASGAPTPGGGSVAALTAAQGAALLAMVAHLTLGRPRFKAHDAEVGAILAEAEWLGTECTASVDRDAAALGALIATYRQPRATAEERAARAAALEERLREATDAPLAVARAGAAIVPLCRRLLPLGNPTAISDVGVAAACAAAAFRSAELNVLINLGQLSDAEYVGAVRRELRSLSEGLAEGAEGVLREVRERL